MEIEDRIKKLEEFKQAVVKWAALRGDSARRTELRMYINQNTVWVRQEVIEANCFHTLNISPPPMLGGLVMRDVDPFTTLFDPPYDISMDDNIVDMIDRTIGVLKTPVAEKEAAPSVPKVAQNIEKNYAFIAMPLDPDNPALEDVLDAIKEGAGRCGIQAERVDEVQSNERITDRILESIDKAEYVIVDLTDSRPNVFYEAGYAQGTGKIPIYVARHSTRLEFDLKDYPVILFRNMKELKDKLEARLRALAEKKK